MPIDRMTESLSQTILKATDAKQLVRIETIQALWSGYGQIMRCHLEGGNTASIVVKHVQLPKAVNHPRGWNTDISHQRKLKSYQVEMDWYADLAQQCTSECRVPRIHHLSHEAEEMLMIMEDLNASGFPLRKTEATLTEMRACLHWLAHFHAKYLGVTSDKLWRIGTYWHLDTRPDELVAMQDKELQTAAQAIDQVLNTAKFQTLVHGDAKLANFCFSQDGTQVAAVDFQYIGHGCGMKDVAYFLSSCLHEDDLTTYESELLSYYFEQLKLSLKQDHPRVDVEEIQQEWSQLYDYAWADFYRFLDGWSPGHWKMHDYSEAIKNRVLSALS
ncbi:ecdysteroid 22-kinase family protein [Reichenbachiella carrageenanivorans]|uniref:Ecdysteroid 22-kinase family protein n=1 Tax=Reichenbachiella carrageenanivorans TaxID=2979869 RepID=A0ABY6CXG6_9BACT|nr:ecdysteroid 22-kinase family protein [Reichenbachiella carrageenanivorans]UXX78614.1 ecdysteroid 22-kinase family protein [Reichenbachiella carrageenanivorans]